MLKNSNLVTKMANCRSVYLWFKWILVVCFKNPHPHTLGHRYTDLQFAMLVTRLEFFNI